MVSFLAGQSLADGLVRKCLRQGWSGLRLDEEGLEIDARRQRPVRVDGIARGDLDMAYRDALGEGGRDLLRREGAGSGVPLFKSVFPTLAAGSSRVRYTGRKRRSCSPV